jgi:hypothetical protein
VQVVTYAGWESIDAAEKARGEPRGAHASSSARGRSFWRRPGRDRPRCHRAAADRALLAGGAGRLQGEPRFALGGSRERNRSLRGSGNPRRVFECARLVGQIAGTSRLLPV